MLAVLEADIAFTAVNNLNAPELADAGGYAEQFPQRFRTALPYFTPSGVIAQRGKLKGAVILVM